MTGDYREVSISSLVSGQDTQLLNRLTCRQMVSGTVGENSHWALSSQGPSRMAARVFLMSSFRDIHFEQTSVAFSPRLLHPPIFFSRLLSLAPSILQVLSSEAQGPVTQPRERVPWCSCISFPSFHGQTSSTSDPHLL